MQRLEVSRAVRPIYVSLGVKGLNNVVKGKRPAIRLQYIARLVCRLII